MKKLVLTLFVVTLMTSCGKQESKVATFKPDETIGKDAAISESNAGGNFSTLDRIHMLSLSSNDSIKNDVRSLLRFGFNTLKKEVTIDSAFIYLQSIDPGHFGKNNSFVLLPIKNVWINDDVNWENQPSVDQNQAIVAEAPKDANQDYKINVTDYITSIYINKQPNYGLLLKLEDEKGAYKGVRFHSSNSKDTSKHPKLEIYYHE